MDSTYRGDRETDLGYKQLFVILLRRSFLIGSIFISSIVIAALVTKLTQPTYQSRMQLLVEPNYSGKKPTEANSALSPERQSGFSKSEYDVDYATQLTLLRSSQFIQKAVDVLRPQYPDIKFEDLQKNLRLSQIEQDKVKTKIFQAVYADNDPVKTQKVLEALKKVYQDYNLSQNNLHVTQGLSFINKELPQANNSYLKAQGELKRFRENQSLIDPQEQATVVAENLNKIQQERLSVRAQYDDTQARYQALQAQVGLSPQEAATVFRLSESVRYQSLLNELQKTDLELRAKLATFTEASPQVRDLQEKRQEQLGLVQQEINQVLAGVPGVANLSAEELINRGQQGDTEIELARKLVDTYRELVGLQARERQLAENERSQRAVLNQLPKSIADYERLKPEVEIQRDTIKELLQLRQDLSLELAQGGFKWQVVESPHLGEQISPSMLKNLLLGIVAGGFLGCVAAFAREALDDTIRTSEDLKQKVGLPVLGTIPDLSLIKGNSRRKNKFPEALMTRIVDSLAFRESIDLTQKNIQLLNTGSAIKSLLVTSAKTGEGKSTLALGLAISAARLYNRVLLIDADFRNPTLHASLNLPNERGLSSLLSDYQNVVPDIYNVSLSKSNIQVLPAGPMPTDPVKLLSSQRMKELMAGFERAYDLIIIDGAPVLGMADTIQLASFCSGVVMVLRLNQISQSEIAQAAAMLNRLNLIGIVANRANDAKNQQLARAEQNGNASVSQEDSLLKI